VIRSYRQFSGQNLGRLAAISDGIFAVAMTVLVLNIQIPNAVAAEATVWNALVPLGPHLLTYLMSFLTLGIFWAGQQTQLNYFTRTDHRLTWIHLVFLLAVVFMPFSTALLAEFITYRLPMAIYWVNLFMLGARCCLSALNTHREPVY
jgi:uncharacterized membrane protein